MLERVDQLVAGMRVPAPGGPRPVDPDALRRTGGGVEYSRAGHLPALLVRAGGVTPLDDAGGPLIGFGGVPRTTGAVDAATR